MKPALALALLIASGSALGADLSLSVRPLFEGRVSPYGPVPFIATVANRGPDAVGALRLGERNPVSYPVNLPRGSTKRITVIASPDSMYSGVELLLATDQGRVAVTLRPEIGYVDGSALMIGGASGELGFLDPGRPSYVRSDLAPDRPILYAPFDFVVLAETAERMSDAAVRALQTWAAAGGTVVLLGGASSPLLHDPRWVPFVPMAPTGAREVRVPRSLQDLWGRPMPSEPIAVTVGRLAGPSEVRAQGPVPLVIDRALGQGKVVQFAFNPFDEPLRTWPGLNKLFRRHAPPHLSAIKSLGTDRGYEAQRFMYSPPSGGYVRTGPSTAYPAFEEPLDAFNIELPPWSTILTLLIVYAVLVVPANFLVLRRLRRAEWAWITAPLLSLAFAAAFFSFAGTLYRTPLTSASEGMLVWDTRLPQGYLVGRSQVFVPRAGQYDLGLERADFVGNGEYDEYGMGVSRVTLNLVDTGTLHAPDARFANLTYSSLSFGQIVPTQGWLEATAVQKTGGMAIVTLRNNSPHGWTALELRGANGPQKVPDLAPGGSWTSPEGVTVGDVRAGPGPGHAQLGLLGAMVGFRAGAQLGRDATRPGAVRFYVTIDLEVPKP